MSSQLRVDSGNEKQEKQNKGTVVHRTWRRISQSLTEGFLFLKVRKLRTTDLIFFGLLETVGTIAFLLSGLPLWTMILGSVAVILLFLVRWNLSRIAAIFDAEISAGDPKTPLGEMRSYQRRMGAIFVLLSLPIFLVGLTDRFESLFGGSLAALPLLLATFLTLGFAYSLGLATRIGMSGFRSSLRLASEQHGLFRKRGASPHLLRSMLQVQHVQVGSALLALLLVPYLYPNLLLVLILAGYSGFLLILVLTSTSALRIVRIFPGDVEWLLRDEHFAYVGTIDEAGMPHLTPVIFIFDGRSLFIAVSRASKKLKNLNHNPSVSLIIDSRDPMVLLNNRAVQIQGHAKIYGIASCLVHAIQVIKVGLKFRRKYPTYASKYLKERKSLPPAWGVTLILSRYLVRIDPTEVTYWKGPSGIRVET